MRWIGIQARFVDTPEQACADAERLLEQVLRLRGYPVDEDFDTQADLVSVDHPNLTVEYRRCPRGDARHRGTRASPRGVFRSSSPDLPEPVLRPASAARVTAPRVNAAHYRRCKQRVEEHRRAS